MYRYINYIVMISCTLWVAFAQAQDGQMEKKLVALEQEKIRVEQEEKDALREEVENINKQLDKGEVTADEAQKLKREAAQKRALNIENRLAIINNKIELVKRGEEVEIVENQQRNREFDDDDDRFIWFKIDKRPRKFDRRTTSDIVFAVGFNNAIQDGQSFSDSDYRFGGSRFAEFGLAWKTRVFDNSNFLRVKYGISFQVNNLKPTNNRLFVQDGNLTSLEEFEFNLEKSKLKITNLVVPLHFEFGPSKKFEGENYFRYSTHKQFKIGLGGYAGFNIDTRQKLKYNADGNNVKDKIKRDFNVNTLVYGLSGYVALGDVGLYVKYDLNNLFDEPNLKQNNISLGVRFDMD